MTRPTVFLRTVLLALVVALISAAPSAAGTSAPSGVCTPSWGSLVLPICV